MHSIEHFFDSAFIRVVEVKDQRKDELMADEAEDERGYSFHLLKDGIDTIAVEPIQVVPMY